MGTFRKLAKVGAIDVGSLITFDGASTRHMKPTTGNAKYLEISLGDMMAISETHVSLPEFKVQGHGKEAMGFTVAIQFNPKLLPSVLFVETVAGKPLEIPSSLVKFKRERLEGLDFVVRLYLLEV